MNQDENEDLQEDENDERRNNDALRWKWWKMKNKIVNKEDDCQLCCHIYLINEHLMKTDGRD